MKYEWVDCSKITRIWKLKLCGFGELSSQHFFSYVDILVHATEER